MAPNPTVVSFGVPLPSKAVTDVGRLAVTSGGAAVHANVRPLLPELDATGAPIGVRSVLVELPPSVLHGDCGEVDVAWGGQGLAATPADTLPYAATSVPSDEIVDVADRTIVRQNGRATLVESDRKRRSLFTGQEPSVVAVFPPGYLAATGVLGPQVDAADVSGDLAGLKFVSDAATPFALSAMYQETYALNPRSVVDPEDRSEEGDGYEAWLYDRCATFLSLYAHTSDVRFLREGYRACSWYAGKIALSGDNRGIFTGKPEADPKYSHARGLYAYYALTGDEKALDAAKAIADLWMHDPEFVAPYRAGHTRGPDKLWTERLLATSLEGLYYGHLFTGDKADLDAFRDLLTTAHRHITGDAKALADINPGSRQFPPQDCFIHNGAQASDGNAGDPWCSGWMPALAVDVLTAYQRPTDDGRVDDILVRLTRFLRDTGSSYLSGDLRKDSFLSPSVRYDGSAPAESRRRLVPLYGAGRDADGKRRTFGEYDDFEHCLDASALTAAGIRALKRSGGFDGTPVGPFPSEGASFVALHHEFAACASLTLADDTRPHRDPATFTPAELEKGVGNPKKFLEDNKIGYPSHNVSPQRKLSWWFNPALEEFALLRDAGVAMPDLRPGQVQPHS